MSVVFAIEGYWLSRLRSSSTTIEAVVTEKSIKYSRGGGKDHVIRYQFSVAGTAYTRSDGLSRTNLWVGLPKRRWLEVDVGTEIPVVYLAANPRINSLTEEPSATVEILVGLLSGVVFLALGALSLKYDFGE